MELLNGKYENMYFHIGANMDQNLAVDIADMRADALRLIGTEPVEETEAGEVETVATVEVGGTDAAKFDLTIDEDSSYEGSFTLKVAEDGGIVTATLTNGDGDVIGTGTVTADTVVTIGDISFTIATADMPGTGATITADLTVSQVDPATLEEAEVPSLENTIDQGVSTGRIENVVVDVESGYGGDYTVRVGAANEVTVIGPDGQQVGKGTIADDAVEIGGFTITFDGSQIETDEFTITVTPAEVPEEGVVDESTMHGINVDTREAANEALSTIDEAISMVSEERSKLGAMQNRLEHTIANLGTSAENLQAAESRIRDLDMAEEIMAFTKNNILQQAATAMLAQANMAPQSVLQLLG
jgi:flagellin